MTLTITNNIVGIISGGAVIIAYLLNSICGQHQNPVSISLSTHQERAKQILFRKICILLFFIIMFWVFNFLLFCLDKNEFLDAWGNTQYVFKNGWEGYTGTPEHNLARSITIAVCTIIAALVPIGVFFICKILRGFIPTYASITKKEKIGAALLTIPIVYYGRMMSFAGMYNTDFEEFLIIDIIISVFMGLMIYAEITILLYKKLNYTAASIMTIYDDMPIYIYETKENCVVGGDNYFLEASSDIRIIPLEKIENSVYMPEVLLDSVLLTENVVFDKSVFDKHNFVLRTIAADYYDKCQKVLPKDAEIRIEYKFSDFVYTIKSGDDIKTYSVYRNYLRDNEWPGNVLLMDSLMKNM